MNYVEKSFEDIFESMLEDSLENGLISHAEDFQSFIANRQDISNYYVMDKSVIALWFARYYEDLTKVYYSAKVNSAEGNDLDDVGATVGVLRPQATCAEVELTFTLTASVEEDINISEGIIVSTESGIEYETLEPLYISSSEMEATVIARTVNTGIASKVSENSLINIVSSIGYNITCTNKSSSTGGSEAYTDEEYRDLIRNHKLINLKGSTEAYLEYFANLDGLDSYNIVPNWDGAGTTKIVVDPGTDTQLNRIYDDLQIIVSQNSEDITLFSPTKKPIDIYASVNVDIDQINPYSSIEKEEIKSRILTAIKIFIDGGYVSEDEWYPGLELGEDFIPHKLAVFLDNEIPELKNISFSYPTDYVPILDDELGVSHTLTVEMV